MVKAHASGPDHGDDRTLAIATTQTRPAGATRGDWVHDLVLLKGADPGRRARLGSQPLRLGRRPPCELVLPDSEVSALHCQVSAVPGVDAATVQDLGSTNGTFVDGRRIAGPALLANGALLQVGRQVFRHEFRPPHEAERADDLERELEQASRYIRSLLPPPMRQGPVRTEWVFEPSTRLGGDAFGYFALDADRFAGYLIDVAGHGVGAAVHTVSVLNVMRQRALPGVDFADPAQVLARLNAMYQMDEHGGLFFTLWYGVYDRSAGTLRYGSAGHHAACLVAPGSHVLQHLQTRNPIIGALPGENFVAASVAVQPGSSVYLFSDGVFEIETASGRLWGLADFMPLLLAPPAPGLTEPERLWQAVRAVARPGPLNDDFSLLHVTFMP